MTTAEKILMAIIVVLALTAAFTIGARAQEMSPEGPPRPPSYNGSDCAPHNVAVQQLAKVFNEKVVGLGLGKNNQSVVELYVSSTGSWTILVTLLNGVSCIAAAGEKWQEPDVKAGYSS